MDEHRQGQHLGANDRTSSERHVLMMNASPRLAGNICCVGKIISDKKIKLNVVHNVLTHAWK